MNTTISQAYQIIKASVGKVVSQTKFSKGVTLVAVSKTKPIDQIKQVYDENQRDFGENYVDELCEKAPLLPNDIRWHFIGHLQSNKVSQLMKIQNLYMIQSVDNLKLAQKINQNCEKNGRKMNILLQVKLSSENTKFGADIEEIQQITQSVITNLKNLTLKGYMTIGEEGDIEVFSKLFQLRKQICENLALNTEDYELSMGMSADYEQAILHGATLIRVGSSIFGSRVYPQKTTQQEFKDMKQ